jgi:diaminobutyrate-2-oxoglutarate transaminase
MTTNWSIIDGLESVVRSYSAKFPTVFATAHGDVIRGEDESSYLDFFAGAGALNYGHNPPHVKQAVLEYLRADGLVHGLDLATTAKAAFLRAFQELILAPRGLDYRIQSCSPAGAEAIEAAVKLARLATGRSNVVAFSGGFHGMSTGALSLTGASSYRHGLDAVLNNTVHIPYPDSPLGEFDSLDLLRRLVQDPSSGVETPAAVVVETIQCEGGIYLASDDFLRGLRDLCTEFGMLLIVDDIQVGCGRTGTFFSFESAGIEPDLVTLSKSISGYGFPMALLLIRPNLDLWKPGQHNGTFRGNQLAFVAAEAALREFWSDGTLTAEVCRKGAVIAERLSWLHDIPVRGRGLVWGIDLGGRPQVSTSKVGSRCFERGLIIESCGRNDEVLKILPPLTVSDDHLRAGLDILLEVLAYDDAVTADEQG